MEPLTVNEVVARNVYRLRRARGWSQSELAERLNAKTPPNQNWDFGKVSKAEWTMRSDGTWGTRPKRIFSPDELIAFARVFGVSLFALFNPADDEQVATYPDPSDPDTFFLLAFHNPYRRTLADSLRGNLLADPADPGDWANPNTFIGYLNRLMVVHGFAGTVTPERVKAWARENRIPAALADAIVDMSEELETAWNEVWAAQNDHRKGGSE